MGPMLLEPEAGGTAAPIQEHKVVHFRSHAAALPSLDEASQ